MREKPYSTLGSSAAKGVLAFALLAVPGEKVQANVFECHWQTSCDIQGGCYGSAFVQVGCEIWCYMDGGQHLSGYAVCS